ncbi:hypothetical protein HN014_13270 [Aquimarina sp. TRL1]|uniref:hypothetical protein n=1 Tax=Aquimarina sp. (strain TRL1) TaxID=2736252 RepID=UPI00158B39BF|nr:hypothetical protein [Aquimarina sp. TRL1]QKX05836.1 hypothetical protein HN014_13270 [Aquimarina sp. TRL1]
MRKNPFIELLLALILVVSCSKDTPINEPVLASSNIVLNFDTLDVLHQKNISITIANETTIDSIIISIDSDIEKIIYLPPYEYNLNGSQYSDGEHLFNVEVFQPNQNSVNKSVKFRIDNNGPVISNLGIIPDQVICNKITLNPTIEDAVTNVKNVQFLVNDILVSEVQENSNHTFEIDSDLYPEGQTKLKFLMEDEVGNLSSDSINILIGKPLIKINLPNKFTRASEEKLLIMLSDAEGNYIDSKVYNNQPETLEFCNTTITPDTEYMLTFFEVFDNSIYNVFCYNNLSKNRIGNEITLEPRPLTNSHAFIELSTSNLNLSGNIRASGQGYSMVNINDTLSGTITTSYTNNLGSSKTLIKAYNYQSVANDYKWAFIDHLENVSALQPSDFSNNNVITNSIHFNSPVNSQFLRIYGFENTELMNVFSGHDLYESDMRYVTSLEYKYNFPDIFSDYFYSLKANNYYMEGLGLPPQSINVPNLSIDFSLAGNQLNFQGIPNYEVGRIRIENETKAGVHISIDNPSIMLEFIFDGTVDKIVIPKIPSGLFEGDIHEVFNNADFTPVQAIAENYSSFSSYQDYLQNVFINSNPFYFSSNSRERVFKSFVSPHILPVWEYPYFTRF